MQSHEQMAEAEALEFAANLSALDMEVLGDVCDNSGESDGSRYWRGRAAGLRFGVHRVVRMSQLGESAAMILLALHDLRDQVGSLTSGPYQDGWQEGIQQVSSAVFLTGLSSAISA